MNPETQTAKPGDEVVFWCVGNGVSSSTVLINSTAFDSSNRDEFESQGINETKQQIDAGTYNLTTTVLVSEWMNNTELRCRFDNGDYTVSSEVAFLIVAGENAESDMSHAGVHVSYALCICNMHVAWSFQQP